MGEQQEGARGVEGEAGSDNPVEKVLLSAGFVNKGEAEHPIGYPNAFEWIANEGEDNERKVFVSPAVEQPGVTVLFGEKEPLAFVSDDGSVEVPGSDKGGSIEDALAL